MADDLKVCVPHFAPAGKKIHGAGGQLQEIHETVRVAAEALFAANCHDEFDTMFQGAAVPAVTELLDIIKKLSESAHKQGVGVAAAGQRFENADVASAVHFLARAPQVPVGSNGENPFTPPPAPITTTMQF
jgi:hypothetical protein